DAVGADEGKTAVRAGSCVGLFNRHRDAIGARLDSPGGSVEEDFDRGDLLAGAVEDLGQVSAVNDAIAGAECRAHGGTQLQRDQGFAAGIGVDVDACRLEAGGRTGVVQPEIVEYFPGVRADLQAGAEFGDGGAALKQHDPGARPCQHQSQGQAGNPCSGNMIGAARVGHGPNSGSVEQGGNRVGSA